MEDSSLFYVLLVFFIMLAVFMPALRTMYNDTAVTGNQAEELQNEVSSLSEITPTGVLALPWSFIQVAFWSFGDIPIYMELIVFVPLRIMFYYIGYKAIRGIGS